MNRNRRTRPSRPSGPPSAETRERVLDAAERLFAERGIEAVSIRDITRAAGVNLAAINYHFWLQAGTRSRDFQPPAGAVEPETPGLT
jgi:hypothetical protein